MKIDAIMIKPQDNVATALRGPQGRGNSRHGLRGRAKIPPAGPGHRLWPQIRRVGHSTGGATSSKYGEIIGRATCPIPQGSHAHVQNIESLRGRGDLN